MQHIHLINPFWAVTLSVHYFEMATPLVECVAKWMRCLALMPRFLVYILTEA